MKKSVIFWNVIAILVLLFLYIKLHGILLMIFLVIISALGVVTLMEHHNFNSFDVDDFRSMKTYSFNSWWAYLTPPFIIYLLFLYIKKGVINFNSWLDRK